MTLLSSERAEEFAQRLGIRLPILLARMAGGFDHRVATRRMKTDRGQQFELGFSEASFSFFAPTIFPAGI